MAKKKKSKAAADPDAPQAPVDPIPPPPKEPVDPKWMWPPFPAKPDGVEIISFSDFVPKGILISIDDHDIERDGEGIPTIELQVKHGSGSRRKGKKKKDPLAGLTEEELRKMTWDKRWALGEDMRTGQPLPSQEPQDIRFEESTKGFREGRPWDHTRQEIWDQWRLYVGLISGVKKPFGKKAPKYEVDDERPLAEEPGIDEDLSDEDLTNLEATAPDPRIKEEPVTPVDKTKADRDQEKYERLLAAREERTDFWLKETEKATKIYFSSYYRDKGLMWSQPYTRDGPLLLRFYLHFVLRNKLFDDPTEKQLVRGYEKALAVVEQALDELPYTFKISRAFPETWGQGCSAVWGEICVINYSNAWATWKPEPEKEAPDVEAMPSNEQETPGLAKLVSARYSLGEKAIIEKGQNEEKDEVVDSVPEEAAIEEVNEEEPTVDMVNEAGGNEGINEDGFGGWGKGSEHGDLVKEWGTPEELDDGWAIAEFTYPSISMFVGPSTIPLNFTPIRAEVSTRILIDIRPPDASSSDLMASRLATLVLTPWPKPDDDPDSLVRPPQMWDFGDDSPVTMASRRCARKFDPTKDNITVYVDPEVIPSCKIGLGIGAAWVQVGKLIEDESAVPNKPAKKGSCTEWWYMERLDFVVPSFWTVNEEHRDMTRLENNPAYAYSD